MNKRVSKQNNKTSKSTQNNKTKHKRRKMSESDELFGDGQMIIEMESSDDLKESKITCFDDNFDYSAVSK